VNPGRTPLVAGNWKMNTSVNEGIDLARQITAMQRPAGVEVAILPPFTHLWALRDELAGSGIKLGAQDCFWEDSGAFTGEVSPASLSGWCDFVLVGHSERRHLLGETDEQVAAKLRRALTWDLSVILAVGETLDERESGVTDEVIHRQLDVALASVDAAGLQRCVVAYEPVWAIGTGRTATPEIAQTTCAGIRGRLRGLFDAAGSEGVRILYGGSVTADNATSLFGEDDIDGGLVGGASLRPADFARIVAAAGPP
jgi:triosephosphate isomerase